MKVALVYDRVNKWGGAERVLLTLHELWPDAPLFTAVHDKRKAGWADVFDVHPSFLQNLPHEFLPWITPLAFETFNFDGFDVVISVTSAEAKNIITKPGTVHVCYCLTPTRYLWSAETIYQQSGISGRILKVLSPTLKRWDLVASSRPDYYIAISNSVKNRIEQYYHRTVSRVIYPPVDMDTFQTRNPQLVTRNRAGYFLAVARLVGYKRLDLVIDAFNRLGWPLIIVGEGKDRASLTARAAKNITFMGLVSDKELPGLYEGSRGFVHAGIEDFGIAAVEAQAAGIPVVAYGEGGIAEIVIPGVTGELFGKQSADALITALQKVQAGWYDSALCRKNAARFSKARFKREMKRTVESLYNTYLRGFREENNL